MEQIVRVHRLRSDGRADVILVRESACSGDCHKCSGCGAVQESMVFTAQNPIGAKPGEFVTVRTESGQVLTGAAMLYILPLALFFAGYLIFELAWSLGALGGGLAFVLAIVIVALYDRLVVRRQNITYTITGFAPQNANRPKKGDNDLD